VPDDGLTARQRQLATHGRSLFTRLATALDEADAAVVPLGDDAVGRPAAGGMIYVAADRTVYHAGPAVDFDTGLREFRAGASTAPKRSRSRPRPRRTRWTRRTPRHWPPCWPRSPGRTSFPRATVC
jgi:hypothetical protein